MNGVLIRNGLIYDGSGSRPYRSDLLIEGGRIARIAPRVMAAGARVLDAEGLAVCPGFIDIHTHCDLEALERPELTPFVCQGVTSILVGLCGLGFIPMDSQTFRTYLPCVSGIFGTASARSETLFSSLDTYLGAVRAGCNVAAAVPHAAVRIAGAGVANVPLTGERLDKARRALRDALEQGAVGFSTGIAYFPQYYADSEELFALTAELPRFDVPLMTHLRSCYLNGLERFDPTWEAAEAALRTGAKLHILHYKTRWPEERAGTAHLFSAHLDDASRRGADITYELYPYNRGASLLTGFLPEEYAEGGFAATMERLSDSRLRSAMEAKIGQRFEAMAATGEPFLSCALRQPAHEGMSVRALAASEGVSEGRLIRQLLLANQLGVSFLIADPADPALRGQMERRVHGDILSLMSRPDYYVGSDAIPVGGYPHPRLWGCFPKMLRLARDQGMPMETMIHHLTQMPARRFQLKDRGELREGAFGDITVLDAAAVSDSADYARPTSKPVGIRHVLVNGEPVLLDGVRTESKPGRGLRRGQ